MNLTNILKKTYIQILVILIAIIATYSHTLDVPFYLDDFSSIRENSIIYNWQGTFFEIWNNYKLRVVGYLSFALNYQVHQFQVAGYHVINIFIHMLAGLAVFGLLRGLMQTPALQNKLSEQAKIWLPLIVALIFVLHPLQIQAVTYIVQRLASLAALFYIAAMACYIQARLNPQLFAKLIWILLCLLLAALAFFTKQNTVTLPIALLLLELIFFPGHIRRFILTIITSIIALFIIWYVVATVFNLDPFSLKAIDQITRETTQFSRLEYFATQMKVLWTYISLFLWPISSHIDYYYSISQGFFIGTEHYNWIARIMHSQEFWGLIGHLILLIIAAYNLRKRPLIAFGILFYYLAHGIESSFIPIKDVIFEHRTYLPNLGLAILFAYMLVVQIPQIINNRTVSLLIILIVLIVMGTATWQRNQMWRDPVALWQHNVKQSPKKKRAWNILGKHLIQQGKLEARQGKLEQSKLSFYNGIKALERSIYIRNNSESISLTPETALNLIVAYKNLRQYDNALMWINRSLSQRHKLGRLNHAKFLVNKGNIYFELGRENHKKANHIKAKQYYLNAKKAYEQALKIDKHNLKAQINLGNIFAVMGETQQAISIYEKILAIDPSNARVRKYLEMLKK
jgi:tetratricopeptide (TPR) repeat protein